ncbi:MAG: NfeD family protein [Ruminococcus sp.]|nr:NfeD family protein [Ruminococcus sp.]
MNVIVWALIVIALIILEIVTVQLVSVWFAVGAFITMLAVNFSDISVTGQLILFAISSGITFAITFPLTGKIRNRKHIPTNTELNVGRKATVTEEVNKYTGTGRVLLDGVYWKAVSDVVIEVDSMVIVEAVEDTKLIVYADSQEVI